MFVHAPAAEAAIDAHIDAGRANDALANIVVGVHNHYKTPQAAHSHLYYPGLDRQLERLAQALAAQHPDPLPAQAPSANNLIIATELYQVGGHSRVVEDFARELESPILVLTDMFGSYRTEPRHLDWLVDAFGRASVIVLPQRTLWTKCQALLELTRRLQPRNIFYFNHHQDPVPFVGTLSHPGARKTLIHHADHNPSLGATLPALAHVDLTDELAATCRRELAREVSVLPLYVADAGCKDFTPFEPGAFSVVTSGTQVKFARSGELALQRIAQTVLRATRGRFFHIGPLDAEWLAEIHAHLQSADVDPTRFVTMGSVPSLWQSLAALDAHVYLGSAPVGGARAAIEAQGCGYPLAYYRVNDPGSLVAVDSIVASKELGWSTLEELATLLGQFSPDDHARWSARSRSFYDGRYSRQQFLRELGRISRD